MPRLQSRVYLGCQGQAARGVPRQAPCPPSASPVRRRLRIFTLLTFYGNDGGISLLPRCMRYWVDKRYNTSEARRASESPGGGHLYR